MNIKEISRILDNAFPLELAEEWDNCGLMLAVDNRDIKKILVALEVTVAVIDEAISIDADLILTHHPLFFGAFNAITDDVLPTKYSIRLIQEGISVYSAHTNFDCMEGGNNDYFGTLLGIKDIETHGIYRSGKPDSKTDIRGFARLISEKLDIPIAKMKLIGNPDSSVSHIAWCTGAGSDYMMDAYDLGVDLYITGDIKYHEAMTADEFGINILDIGHFGSEKIFTHNMANLLRNALNNTNKIEIVESKVDKDPFNIVE